MIKSALISIIALCLSFNATAQTSRNSDVAPPTVTTSFGMPDCGQWTNKTRPGSDIWLSGYLNGLNKMFNITTNKSSQAYDPLGALSSMDQAFVWMDNWCKANPLSDVDEGAVGLFTELVSKKSK